MSDRSPWLWLSISEQSTWTLPYWYRTILHSKEDKSDTGWVKSFNITANISNILEIFLELFKKFSYTKQVVFLELSLRNTWVILMDLQARHRFYSAYSCCCCGCMGAWSTAYNPFLGWQSHLTALQWPNKLLVLAMCRRPVASGKWQDETLPVTSGGASFPSTVATWVVVFVIYTDFMTCCVLSVFPPAGVNNFMARPVCSRLNQRQHRDSLWTRPLNLATLRNGTLVESVKLAIYIKWQALKSILVNSFLSIYVYS